MRVTKRIATAQEHHQEGLRLLSLANEKVRREQAVEYAARATAHFAAAQSATILRLAEQEFDDGE